MGPVEFDALAVPVELVPVELVPVELVPVTWVIPEVLPWLRPEVDADPAEVKEPPPPRHPPRPKLKRRTLAPAQRRGDDMQRRSVDM